MWKHLKILTKYLTCLALILITPLAFSTPLTLGKKSSKPYVNILTWWGYLSATPNKIKQIEKRCGVNISYDTYYSNNEFVNRFENTEVNYDIIIFSQTVLDAVKDKINLPNSTLYKVSKDYNPTIRKHYQEEKLPHNVAFFMQSLTGFLYNPSVIQINKKDSVKEIFDKANKNIVVMIDDPVEANFLISLLLKRSNTLMMKKADQLSLTWNNFKSVVQNAHVIITNEPYHIIQLPNFAFAFQWSGDAIAIMEKSHGKLKFLVHPKLSYISSDLLAELNVKKSTQCVAKALTSEPYLTELQNKTFYFSPYGNYSNIKNPYFKSIYIQTLHELPYLPWIVSVSMSDFMKIKNSWSIIQYKLQRQYEKQ